MSALTDPHLSLVRPVTPRTPDGCQEIRGRRSGARTTAHAR
jgi:hypothetical protein